jgi:hypothetical protein
MLPPELEEYGWVVDGIRGPSLSSVNASDGYSQRIRIVVVPPYAGRPKVMVRLDQSEAGRTVGLFAYGQEGPSRWEVTRRRQFNVSAEQMTRLEQLMREAGLWEKHQLEDRTGQGACVDGTYVALERASASGYQFSVAHAPCGASVEYMEVINYIGALAGTQETLKGWFRY